MRGLAVLAMPTVAAARTGLIASSTEWTVLHSLSETEAYSKGQILQLWCTTYLVLRRH